MGRGRGRHREKFAIRIECGWKKDRVEVRNTGTV